LPVCSCYWIIVVNTQSVRRGTDLATRQWTGLGTDPPREPVEGHSMPRAAEPKCRPQLPLCGSSCTPSTACSNMTRSSTAAKSTPWQPPQPLRLRRSSREPERNSRFTNKRESTGYMKSVSGLPAPRVSSTGPHNHFQRGGRVLGGG
jgi:hypothetical protein